MENKDFPRRKQEFQRNIKFISLSLILILMIFGSFALAQDLPTNIQSGLPSGEIQGTPVTQMIEALTSGGLNVEKNGVGNLLAAPLENPVPAEGVVLGAQDSKVQDSAQVLDSNSLENLESKGGLVTGVQATAGSDDQTIFKLASRFLARVVFRNDTEFMKRPKFEDGMDIAGTPTFDGDTAGYAVIQKGNQSVEINFDQAYENPPVVTATLSLQQYKDQDLQAAAADLLLISDVKYIISGVTAKGFQIVMDHRADSDIPFSWHALAVSKPKTYKKESDLTKNADVAGAALDAATGQNPKDSKSTKNDSLPQAVGQSTDILNPSAAAGAGTPAAGEPTSLNLNPAQ